MPFHSLCPILVLVFLPGITESAEYWLTTANPAVRLEHHQLLPVASVERDFPKIVFDPKNKGQAIEGFGFTLTGGSARLLAQLPATTRQSLLDELFRPPHGLGINLLRVSIGASDLDEQVFSYNDLTGAETDHDLRQFSLRPDETTLIPILREIVAICPELKLMATPWSPPLWMKTNRASTGGHLRQDCYRTYSNYLMKYLDAMERRGLVISALSLQNEPANGENNPSMLMSANEQKILIRDYLGPALTRSGMKTRLLIWDHNCDQTEYPLEILKDPQANTFIFGTAFHLYAGRPEGIGKVKSAFPDKAVRFTEQWTEGGGDFNSDLLWHIENVLIGTLRQGCSVVLEWNLASDPQYGPHTPGGCSRCLGSVTFDGDRVAGRNVSYYVMSHLARFVPAGSVRVVSPPVDGLPHVAFQTPSGTHVLLVMNGQSVEQTFGIVSTATYQTTLPPRSVATIVW